ncbi:EAL domain, c-di-GMP-specific phosphodiesterase class I (or its enzymatically inactive variant) [Micromonospora pattaloongensis]|uniref:EAL domain, c-di-GMP-specific phosphodiesterase class I (Or its enzymatically inactive variant) n=1 Tax=Micromonospora pattaloongensis TaxID=405436 RepID=A0A1H3LWD2_9ACTN|nr:EAL domain-containing protein [Micromonospora pattaloongensis]SDY68741.1 EAL domain, c-di-GMP-specific phosphodiesterase class I (or its enzymatically inactive variant) [Micromonospora pattaloongensis]
MLGILRPGPYVDIHAVLDARAVTPVFQPLVRIETGDIIGYEALSRGPAGTPWESPAALFAAARQVGRDAELDWVCRAQAYRAALEARLAPPLTLFVNMEPAAWRAGCPADLLPLLGEAQQRLRVVTEMTERAIAADPSALLAATASCRASGWGVALDDVGADPMSLALMPFVHPDVVKLDMQLLRRPSDPYTAQVVGAVLAYAERTGATILAEGIETEEHLAVARSMGAAFGQGWYFGRPVALPARFRPVAEPLRLVQVADPLPQQATRRDAATPFEIVSAARPLTRTTKELLMPISRYLEAKADEGPEPPVLLACFQDERHFTPATARRFSEMAAHAPFIAALAVNLPAEPAPGVRGTRLADDDPLRDEWNVIVVGPHYAAALVARDLGDDGPDRERRFEYAITHDRPLVLQAARSLLHWLNPTTQTGVPATVSRAA